MTKKQIATFVFVALLLCSLFGCKKKTAEPTILEAPTISLNSDNSINVSNLDNYSDLYFKVSNKCNTLFDKEDEVLDLDTFKLDYSTFIVAYKKSKDTSLYLDSVFSDILYLEYTNSALDTTLTNGLSRYLNQIEYKLNITGNNLVIGFDYNSSYSLSNFKIKINDNEFETINNQDFYTSLLNSNTTINKIVIESSEYDLIDLKLSNISYSEDVSFDDLENKIVYTKTCSNEDYFNTVTKEKVASTVNIKDITSSNDYFITEGYVLNRSNDSSLSSYLFDVSTNKYIKINSFSLYKTGFTYDYDNENDFFIISYNEKNNLINNTEYYFNDGDYIKALVYKDENNIYKAEVISKDNSKSLTNLNKKFTIKNIESDYLTLSFDKESYSLNDTVSITYNLLDNYYINKLNVIRFNNNKEEILLNSNTNKYEYKILPNDKLEVELINVIYNILINPVDNNYYFTKVTTNLNTQNITYDYLYKIDETDYTNLSLNKISMISGYILSIDNTNESIKLVDPTDLSNIKTINISSISKLNTSFDLLENNDNGSYASYNKSNTFNSLNLEINKYINLFVLYSSINDIAYGELLNISDTLSLTSYKSELTIDSNSDLSTVTVVNPKDEYNYYDTVEIEVSIDSSEIIKSLTIERFNGIKESIDLDESNKASITLSFKDTIKLVTESSTTTTIYTLTGINDSDDYKDIVYPTSTQKLNKISFNTASSLYNTKELSNIKSIDIKLISTSEGTLDIYYSDNEITDITSVSTKVSVSIIEDTLEYSIDLSSYDFLYFAMHYSENMFRLEYIKITVES